MQDDARIPASADFDFIFMLTRDDRTVRDARALAASALDCGVRHIGFKDIGLPQPELQALTADLKAAGATVYLEVVSLAADQECRSADMAVSLGVHRLLGGVRPDLVLPIIAGSGIKYYPFPGRIEGHPSNLRGTVAEIVQSAKSLTSMEGVHGLDLLGWRHDGDCAALIEQVCAAVDKPVILAGSIDSAERISHAKAAGVAGFTVGTAAMNGIFPTDEDGLDGQLRYILKCVAGRA